MHNQPSSCSGNERAIHPSHSTHTPASASAVDAHRAQVDARLRSSANSRTLVVVLQGTHRAPPCARAQAKQGRGPERPSKPRARAIGWRAAGAGLPRRARRSHPTRGAGRYAVRVCPPDVMSTPAGRSAGIRGPRAPAPTNGRSESAPCCSLPVGPASTTRRRFYPAGRRELSALSPRPEDRDGTLFRPGVSFF